MLWRGAKLLVAALLFAVPMLLGATCTEMDMSGVAKFASVTGNGPATLEFDLVPCNKELAARGMFYFEDRHAGVDVEAEGRCAATEDPPWVICWGEILAGEPGEYVFVQYTEGEIEVTVQDELGEVIYANLQPLKHNKVGEAP
jgi:hypothetical protein